MPRNVSGTYSLPLPPVVPNTVIQSAWANTTTDDIAQGITDSLDRNGRGGMIAPFRLVDGTVLQPAFAFASETGTGIYKVSAGVMGVSVMGVEVAQWSGTAYSILNDFNVAGAVAFNGGVTFNGTLTAVGGILAEAGITSLDDIGVVENFNGDAGFFSTNNSTAANATSGVYLRNSLPEIAEFILTGTGYTAYPLAGAHAGLLLANGTGGLAINANGAAGTIRFAAGGSSEQMRLTADGRFNIGTVGFAGVPFLVRVGLNQNFGVFSITSGTSIAAFTDAGSAAPMRIAAQVIAFSGNGGATDQVLLAASGVITFTAGFVSGAGGNIAYSAPSSDAQLIIQNTSNTANSRARLYLSSAGASGGGANVYFVRPGVYDYSIGLEPTDNSFRISVGATLGVPYIVASAAGKLGFFRVPTGFNTENQGSFGIYAGDFVHTAGGGGDCRFGYESYTPTGCFNLWTQSAVGLNFGTSTAARMKITAGGFFGFGAMASVAGPTFQMDAEFASQAVFRLTYTGGAQVYLQANAGTDVRLGSLTAHPAIIVANGAARITIPVSTSAAITHNMSGGDYTVTIDPGATAANIPIGGFVFAQASGVTGAALSPGGTIALGGGVTLAWQAYTGGAGQTISTGTWRNIGAQTAGGAGMWMRVA
jgi:hypothetical protein